MREGDIQAECLMALSKAGHTVWRNNTGRLQNQSGRWVNFGLCVGSSDIIGICLDGKFLAVEVKYKGRVSDAQKRFIDAVTKKGGRAGVARSASEAVKIASG